MAVGLFLKAFGIVNLYMNQLMRIGRNSVGQESLLSTQEIRITEEIETLQCFYLDIKDFRVYPIAHRRFFTWWIL